MSIQLLFTFRNFVKSRNKIIVADNCQAKEHVEGDSDVNDDTSFLSSLLVHQRLGKLFDGRGLTLLEKISWK